MALQNTPWTSGGAIEEESGQSTLKASEINENASLTTRNNRTKILGGMPKNFVWQRGLSQLFVNETEQTRPNLKELQERCLAKRESEGRNGAAPNKMSQSMATRHSMATMYLGSSQRTNLMSGSQHSQVPLSTGRGPPFGQSSHKDSTPGMAAGYELNGPSLATEQTPGFPTLP